ncbi:FadD3 family acyl-CoA ligase [Actinoplanes rectilineatus]|uniref:FadD3 family acyl-CoA ligase n=1 Tax=Actinoplanes rectilineatus TaxID=113571 RepID=UPI0005F2C809|nr:FadD3 family acyl-CoA ligase [Actinoplanes rectilineatus]
MDKTIPAAVAWAAGRFGDAPALIDPGQGRWTFAELAEQVRTVARALTAAGAAPGDRVAIWAPNTARWVLAALGASCAGATLVPVDTRLSALEAADVIGRSGAGVLIVTGPLLGRDRLAELRATGSPLPEIVISLAAWDELLDRAAGEPGAHTAGEPGIRTAEDAGIRAAAEPGIRAAAVAVMPDDVSDILFTSGTTGRSRGAMSTHRQSLGVATAWAEIAGLGPGDRYLMVNPFFSGFGLKAGLLACLVSGVTIVPQAVFDPGRTLDLVETERISVLTGPPTLHLGLLDHPDRTGHDLSSLRLAVTEAAMLAPSLVTRIRDDLGCRTVLTAYGLTEAVVATMCRPGDDVRTVASTSGRAAAGFEVRIDRPGGEVLLRGPNLMLGYLDDPEATAAAIDADGWLHTGDVGRLDEHGNLTVTDRIKDMYVCGGFTVYPAEVERVLAGLPGVAEAAVIGVPDRRLGEIGKAFVVPRAGHGVAIVEVLQYCRAQLAGYKVPRTVELRAELPHDASGKVLKHLLRESR